MKVIFDELTIQQFLSIGDEPVTIRFEEGITPILGENKDLSSSSLEYVSNGSGKSVIGDALFFSIFGEPLRDLRNAQLFNNVTGIGGGTKLKFSIPTKDATDHYVLTRALDPVRCKLTRNGEDISKSSMAQTTEYLCRLLNTSPDVARNSIIMSINSTLPFMALKKVDRRKFLEGIFQFDIFGKMLLLAREDYNGYKTELASDLATREKTTIILNTYKERSLKFEEEKRAKIEEHKRTIANYHEEIKKLETQKKPVNEKEIQKLNQDIDHIKQGTATQQKKNTELAEITAVLQSNIKAHLKSIENLKTKTNCYACGRPLDGVDIKTVESKVAELTADIEKNKKQLEQINQALPAMKEVIQSGDKKIDVLRGQIDAIKKQQYQNELTQSKIQNLQHAIERYEGEIKEIERETDNFKDLIAASDTDLKQLDDKIKAISQNMKICESAKFLSSEEGVKSFMIKKLIETLNNRINLYLRKLEAGCFFRFNEYFEETILNGAKKECSYFNFSSGERKRIDLAIMLTFIDMRQVQSGISTNVLFLDELLDSSLDEKGIGLVLDILKERVDKLKECLYIVTHRRSLAKSITNPAIYMVKQNGISRRTQLDATNT